MTASRSGPAPAGHPLLEPAVAKATALHDEFGGQGEDEAGHGTQVAGITLYGDVGTAARTGTFKPPFWIASVRVLAIILSLVCGHRCEAVVASQRISGGCLRLGGMRVSWTEERFRSPPRLVPRLRVAASSDRV